jgi:MOSC domain-containing protein YiiM
VRLRVTARNERCRVIDLAQDGVEETARWLKPLGERRDACIAVYAQVVEPGELRVGDPVRVEAR